MLTTPFQREVWAEFIIGACVFFLRFFARWKVVGLKGLALDDLFAAFALVKTPSTFRPCQAMLRLLPLDILDC